MLNIFERFSEGEGVMLDALTAGMGQAYEAWMRSRGLSPNTTSYYIRILRAIYNRAVDEGATDDRKPFGKVYTGVGKTVRRALPLTLVRQIKSLDLSDDPALGYARDVFMLSFYLRGMSLIDMAYLRRSDLRAGAITYRRRKTGQTLRIQWTPEMQAILDRYPKGGGGYLLPILG